MRVPVVCIQSLLRSVLRVCLVHSECVWSIQSVFGPFRVCSY